MAISIFKFEYTLLPDDILQEKAIEQVKDLGDQFVTVAEIINIVGEKDDYKTILEDQRDQLITFRDDQTDAINDQIESLNDRITEIDAL